MDVNDEQERRCYNLLSRISALQIEEVEANAIQQLTALRDNPSCGSQNALAGGIQFTRVVLGDVLRESLDIRDDDTESSSGEEDCDELEMGTKQVEHYLPVEENPGTKWARDRADILSSWSWLEDASSHVSFHLKQQEELHKHVRSAKTPITFDEKPSAPIMVSAGGSTALKDALIQIYKAGPLQQNAILPNNPLSSSMLRNTSNSQRSMPLDNFLPLNYGKPRVSRLLDTSGRTVIPSRYDSKPDGTTPDDHRNSIGGGLEALQLKIAQNSDPTCASRRCMPVRQFRPRKIFRLSKLKVSLIDERSCGCHGSESCRSCCENEDLRFGLDEKIPDFKDMSAVLDYSYHRKLSLIDEIPLTTLLDASLKMEGWKHNTPKSRSTFRSIIPRYRRGYERMKAALNMVSPEVKKVQKNQKKTRGRPKLPRKLNASGHLVIDKSTAEKKFKKGMANIKPPRRASSGDLNNRGNKTAIKRRKYNSISSNTTKKKRTDSLDYDSEEQYVNSYIAPTPKLPGPGRPRLSDSRRQKAQDFDINNIVIPYSIASTTRVEKIEYKEIMTPSWREFSREEMQGQAKLRKLNPELSDDKKPNGIAVDAESDVEDMDEAAIMARHHRCELIELKRFMVGINKTSTRRGRRTDSKTEHLDPTNPTSMASGKMSIAVKKEEEAEDETFQESYGWERRVFPLSCVEYSSMLAEMPTSFFADPPKKKEKDKDKEVRIVLSRQPSIEEEKKDNDSGGDDPDWNYPDVARVPRVQKITRKSVN